MKFRQLCCFAVIFLSACAARQPDLVRLYGNQQGMIDQPPVIIIHGALGAKLRHRQSGKEVWPGKLRDLVFSNYRELELKIDPYTLLPTRPELVPAGITDVIGGVDFYGHIQNILEKAGRYRRATPGEPAGAFEQRYYTFSYDWRLDIVATARKLDTFIDQIRADFADPNLKVDIIAHSMGGLITRYYARYGGIDVLDSSAFPITQAGAHKIRRVVLLGTPNLGSAGALRTLIRGYKVIFGTIPAEVAATFPSTYQVLPHTLIDWFLTIDGKILRQDQFDWRFWSRYQFSVFSPEVQKRIIDRYEDAAEGKAYLRVLQAYFRKNLERARRFTWSLTAPIQAPEIKYIVFGGSCTATPARLLVEEVDGIAKARLYPDEITHPPWNRL